MPQRDTAVRAGITVPRPVRVAGTCFLVLSILLGLFVILMAILGALSWRLLLPALAAFASLYFWLVFRNGADREARSSALIIGVMTILNSGGFIIYRIHGLPDPIGLREAVVRLLDVFFLASAVALVASCTAVVLLMRPESKAFFRSTTPQRPTGRFNAQGIAEDIP